METDLPDSQLVTNSTTTIQKAWHLLSLIVSRGGPTTPLQLASLCTFFEATPDLIYFLCSIPNSPIILTSNRNCNSNNDDEDDGILVTVSAVGFSALKDFLSNFNFVDFCPNRLHFSVRKLGSRVKNDVAAYFRKRKRIDYDIASDTMGVAISPLPKRFRSDFSEIEFYVTEGSSKSRNARPFQLSFQLNGRFLVPDLFVKGLHTKSSLGSIQRTDEIQATMSVPKYEPKFVMSCEHIEEFALLNRAVDNQTTHAEDKVQEIGVDNKMGKTDVSIGISPRDSVDNDCATNDCLVGPMRIAYKEDGNFVDSAPLDKEAENLCQIVHIDSLYTSQGTHNNRLGELKAPDIEQTTNHQSNLATVPTKRSVSRKLFSKSSSKMKITRSNRMAHGGLAVQNHTKPCNDVNFFKEGQKYARDHVAFSTAHRSDRNHNTCTKEQNKDITNITPKDPVELRELPHFESYIVEAEEGSGGYGTVYRARRKNDDTVVAIKCPHPDSHRHYVNNELRMLERFGGKSFIIKYEGSVKSGDVDCLVLEHVVHDRPEVLKREIDVYHLRWYGYCLFRALASLHKQGIAHRDVKPGNFLFSCKLKKGYLIDFNLALDLQQNYGTGKLKTGNYSASNVTLPKAKPAKSILLSNSGRLPNATPDIANKDTKTHSRPSLVVKSLKKKIGDKALASGGWSVMKSQGAEGSGVTSVKDGTSGRTPSAERMREPLPCQGRKALLNLVQEAMQNQNHEALSAPSSMRKRISAPPGKLYRMPIYPTPMPYNSTKDKVVGAAGITGNRGDNKHKREGPCVGTKGFRAPEVLFRSLHQGLKIDVWSAGVTLLYLIIGRTPFYGEPEQNIRDIVKLRGSEDLWEVSKLHDRESSFPVDLYDTRSLPSMTLSEWCKLNTKREDFLHEIPNSLVDLVDKCLTVNPRLRICAEDALKHEFFAPCLEELRKQKLLRQGFS